ncbi:unnamed protein product [Linum tenue]|uniref:Glycosyltransferase n=1 Tax=Linum tenue TaxID=586396 RepID=A0AAV0LI12_9ROSI|nr:unnamed protein product [Linum tenue]
MGSNDEKKSLLRPHAICIPYPAQSHIKASLKLAKILHHRGFFITFVNTEFNHNRFLNTKGPRALDGLPDFRFTTIPDGLPPSDPGSTQDVAGMCDSIMRYMLTPFRALVARLNDPEVVNGDPPVSCIVADGLLVFALDVAREVGVPSVSYWTFPACGFMGFKQYRPLRDQGVTPFKGNNGYLNTPIEVPGMTNMRLKDLPSFIRTTDPNEPIFHNLMEGAEAVPKASALLLHTYQALESPVLAAINSMYPNRVYSVGPMQLLLNQIQPTHPATALDSIGYSLWSEEAECLRWLDTKATNSVIYVSFGSITTMSRDHLIEFAMGLVDSDVSFLWVIRPDLVLGESAALPKEFGLKVEDRFGFISGWCPQEEVLNHPAVGGFITHCGWGSMIESLTAGVPVLCWPFFSDQVTNCRFACVEWEVGIEIEQDVKREMVEEMVRELINGEKGARLRKKAGDWAKLAREATGPGGSSTVGLDRLVNEVLLRK